MGAYQGGVPSPGKNLYPGGSEDNSQFEPNAGPGDINPSKSGPATSDGSSNDYGVLGSSGYHADGELRQGGMKVRDLSDISGDV